ncbi:MAG: hypothetical protein E6K19_08410 [Methanobacteriota archaeon]|nr:MAG: hypothetical protein E6K19_08410 [Euryarchaeota archaeon]
MPRLVLLDANALLMPFQFADDALLDLGQAQGAAVVTLDQPLQDRLRAAGVPRISLRSRNHLAIEGL